MMGRSLRIGERIPKESGVEMITAEFVENALKQLSPEELVKFRQW